METSKESEKPDIGKRLARIHGAEGNPQCLQDDSNAVFWDSDDDPSNPMNWSRSKTWSNIAVLSCLTFLTPLASSMFAPGVPQVLREYGSTSDLLASFVVSVYVLGFAIGPLIVAPLCELYGRLPVYHVSNIGFLIFTIACAVAPSMNSLIAFRFFEGCFGVTPVTIGGGTIADLIPAESRGGAMAIWAMGPLLGPVVGPVAGGFASEALGWRWVFWVIAIATGAISILAVAVLRETYAPTILERKTIRLQRETGNKNFKSKLDTGTSAQQHFIRSIIRPAKMMVLSPTCATMSLYVAVVYGFLYLLFTTFTFVFEETYGFTESTVGLTYIGLGIGNFMGVAVIGGVSDKLVKSMAVKGGGDIQPEYRLPPLTYAQFLTPVGFLIYGWTAKHAIHWAVPLFGTLLIGVGMIGVVVCINTYLVDAFTIHAASAIAACTVLRSIFGAVFPLFGLKMYDKLGIGWGNTLLAFIALALCPIPWLLTKYGQTLRRSPRWRVEF